MASAINVDSETLNRYRQEVLNTVAKWTPQRTAAGADIQLALAQNRQRRLKRCVVCGTEEKPAENSSCSPQRGGGVAAALSPSSPQSQARLSPLDQLLQDFYDRGWMRYDGLDHCYSCARRLACEILAPHFAATRREGNIKILGKVLEAVAAEEQKNSGSSNGNSRSASVESAAADADAAAAAAKKAETHEWHCPGCGQVNAAGTSNCSVCDCERPAPLVCPYCNQDASEHEFCPNDPTDPMENHLSYLGSDPLLGNSSNSSSSSSRMLPKLGGGVGKDTNSSSNTTHRQHGRHDTWTCANTRCRTLNLGMVHPDKCRGCERARVWHCVDCKHEYPSPSSYCPKCFSRHRAGSASELEERLLCKLTGITVEEARRQRRVAAMLDGARQRVERRINKKLSLVNVKAADDGNCLFHALAMQLFRNAELHHLLRLLAVEHIIMEKDNFAPFVFGQSQQQQQQQSSSSSSSSSPSAQEPQNSAQRMDRIFLDYVRTMAADRSWGDALVLHAIARVFHVQIHIVSGAMTSWHNVITPPGFETCTQQQSEDAAASSAVSSSPSKSGSNTINKSIIFVSFIAELHYNSIVLTAADSRTDQCLPYRQWIEVGELKQAAFLQQQQHQQQKQQDAVEDGAATSRNNSGLLERSNGDDANGGNNHFHYPPTQEEFLQQHSNNNESAALAARRNPQGLPAQITSNGILPNAPFDRVVIFFPDESGNPGGFLGFDDATGAMSIRPDTPSYFQRFAAETPRVTRNAFVHKSVHQSFILLDELGKKVVCAAHPMPVRQMNTASAMAIAAPISNECALIDMAQLQQQMARQPRTTVVTVFRDGSCAIGPWMFVIDWQGRRACIVMEQPFVRAKPAAKIEFVDEKTLHQCQACGKWYVLRAGANKGASSHFCPAMQQRR